MIKLIDMIGLILYCALIYLLSDKPTLPVPMLFPYQDKLHHIFAYFIMVILVWRTFKHYIQRPYLCILMSVVFCSFYGITDEWHQSFVQGRHADTADWLADTFGALLAALILHKFFRKPLK
jgi:VanZ family protein